MKLFKFKNLQITPIQDWNKSYNEIVVPKGFRKIKVQELWELLDSDKVDEFLGKYKYKWNNFACEQTRRDKLHNWSRWLYLYRNLDVDSYDGDLANSISGGRVVFVKVKK